jgi:nitrite reductase/ring-hydroxylating ferredoxin subunit
MKRSVVNHGRNSSSLHYLCLKSEILKGCSKSFSIFDNNGLKQDVALFNRDGKFYAISNTCAHEGGPLSQGVLEKTIVTCPWHGWQYDVRNGKSPHPGGDSVKSFKVRAIGNKLYIVLLTSN